MRAARLLWAFALALLLSSFAYGQLVISVHSGVLHFSEGSAFIDDQPLQQKLGTFPDIKEGSTLRTAQGRAEVLLTPGVFLRVDENSSIRMVSTALKNTRVEFLQGSVIVDSLEATADDSVLMSFKDNRVRFPQKGVYRLDSEPPLLQVYNGEAEVTRENKPSVVDSSHLFFFTLGLVTQKFGEGADDDFYRWSKDRSDFISADNRAAAQSLADPAPADPNQIGGAPPLTRDPDLYLGGPNYGGPNYNALSGGLWPYDSLMYSNMPFGIGAWNTFTTYFVYVPLYLRPGRSRYPVRWPYPGLPPASTGISRLPISRSPIITPRGVSVPRIPPVRTGSVGSTAPRIGVTHIGAGAGLHR
ncbi:MAG: hypothetical protein JOY62_13715 [Acidobacteriaceae bacterium]|nr:hypothetical protein [Acidobacteriaceae bacterium]MBV9781019.1 hypothetical protein [Acidobacteriaceae bacterium]